MEERLEEAAAGVCGSQDADRGDGHRFGRIDADDLLLPPLGLLVLCMYSFVDFSFALLDYFGVDGFAELFEDLRSNNKLCHMFPSIS